MTKYEFKLHVEYNSWLQIGYTEYDFVWLNDSVHLMAYSI